MCFRANSDKKEQEAKHRGAAGMDSQIKASVTPAAAAAASSDSQTQLLELKKRNDELEDEVCLLYCLSFDWPCIVALL